MSATPAVTCPSRPGCWGVASPSVGDVSERQVVFSRWEGGPASNRRVVGCAAQDGALVLKDSSKRRAYHGTTYEVGSWTSASVAPGFGFTELVASWSAVTPKNSWVEIRVRVSSASARSRWMALGRWASSDKHAAYLRARPVQRPRRVDVDTWKAVSTADSYQLQVRLMRRAGARRSLPRCPSWGRSPPGSRRRLPLCPLPASRPASCSTSRVSQMVHRGEFAQYGGGGEAWCSPTSTAMVLGYYGRLPAPGSYSWVGSRPDPWVDEVARRTYDFAYEGTGNWPFNTAYAASRGLSAFVTRLRSLSEAESLVAAGIPVIASVSFSSGGLYGAPISSTAGHLLVIVGFTASGDVVANDPAAAASSGVRRTSTGRSRVGLARRLRRHGVRHPRRRAPAARIAGQLVAARQSAIGEPCPSSASGLVRNAVASDRRPCRTRTSRAALAMSRTFAPMR